MIVTLTPNPSLDRTVTLPGPLVRGGVNRLSGVVVEPGGKGVNVARVLVSAGQRATAVLPASAHDPLLLALDAAASAGLSARAVTVAAPVRVNTAVTEPDGTTTKLNEAGAELGPEEIDAVETALLDVVAASPGAGSEGSEDPDGADARSWAVLSGSLPPGAPAD